jgi:hypothetical protein
MALAQQTFLGLSIVSFNGSLGWGSELSTLNVTLVQDPKNLDWGNFPDVGDPVFFTYSGWGFAGLLQSWKYSKGESGFVYNVVCVDPREVLEGYQLILGGYTAQITTPNIANIYGYWENGNFGNSKKNETGTPWEKIKNGVTAICNGSTGYGGPISLRGNIYNIDISALPKLNTNYRIGGDAISLMEFITEVCEAASHDFFVTLQGSTIVINVIDRSKAIAPGALTAYINGLTGVVSSEAGVEHRPETMGKVLLGGQQINMYGQTKGGERIWPFWGFEKNFDVKMGTGFDNDHEVELDSTSVRVPGVGGTYKTNVKELRAVLDGRDSWEDFLVGKNEEGNATTNIHFGKSDKLDLIGFIHKQFKTQLGPSLNMALTKTQIMKASEAQETDHEEAVGRLYDFLLGYARDFYGKQFLVSIPDVDAAREPDTDKVRVSLEPVDAGFIDSDQWDLAVSNNLIPQDIVKLTNEDGRFPPYVRYDNIADLDFSDCPEDSIVYNDNQTSAFIKCSIQQGVAFEDVGNTSSPRAVIILPGIVRDRLIHKLDNGGTLKDITDQQIQNAGVTQEEKDRLLHAYGIDNIYSGAGGMAVVPDLAAIPLQDNTKVYGPWEKIGANGKMEIEQDESLVPWNYGGYAELDIVGNGKVQDNVSFMQELETGSIEVPGVPTFTMGAQIVGSGPYVTDISVSIGEGGITSRYQFSTWTQKFGKLRKSNLSRFAILAKKNANTERKLKERKVGVPGLTNLQKQIRDIKKTKRKGGSSSHGMLVGEGIPASGGGDGFYPNVFIQPHYNFTSQLGASGETYRKKAGMSVDGMFRPYTTNVNESGLGIPYFQTAASGAESPHAQDLMPFQSGHDISVVIRGQDFPEDLSTHNDPYYGEDYRPMALKGPMVLAGWGYDTEGKPVPNESGGAGETRTDNFASGYLKDQSKWPVGPVYMPWDDERKCWVGGGGTTAKAVKITTPSGQTFPCGFQKVYYAEVMGLSFDDTFGSSVSASGTDEFIYVGNFRNNIVLESSVYLAYKMGGKYYLDNQTTFNELGI